MDEGRGMGEGGGKPASWRRVDGGGEREEVD